MEEKVNASENIMDGVYAENHLLAKLTTQIWAVFFDKIQSYLDEGKEGYVRRAIEKLFNTSEVNEIFAQVVYDTIKGLRDYFELAKEQLRLVNESRKKVRDAEKEYNELVEDIHNYKNELDTIKTQIYKYEEVAKGLDILKLKYPDERIRQAKILYDEMTIKGFGENTFEFQRRISAAGKIIAAALGAKNVSDGPEYEKQLTQSNNQ